MHACRRSRLLMLVAVAITVAACTKSPQPLDGAPSAGRVGLPPVPATGPHYAATAWATVHRDSSNSDYVPLSPSLAVEPAWTALDGAALLVGPVIGPEGHLYVPSGRGAGHSHLHAFDAAGRLLWESPVMHSLDDFDYGAVISAPVVDEDGMVYASDLNQLWSFSAAGEVRWVVDLQRHGVGGFFITPIFSREGFVGGVSTDGKLALFRRDTGELAIPVLELPGVSGPPSQVPPPGLWQGGLLAPEFVGQLWDLVFGREVEVANTPAVNPASGRIFITAGGATPAQGVLYGIDTSPVDASIAFTAPMGAGSGTSPAISPDGKLVYAIDDAGLMVAIDSTSGKRVWEVGDTMGQASPSVGPDGSVYSFNGAAGIVVAIDGASGAVKWRRQYDFVAQQHLAWRPFMPRTSTVDGIITVTDNGLLAFLDLNYRLPLGAQPYPQPQKVVVAQLDVGNGDLTGWFEARDSSGAFVIPDVNGNLYLSLSGAATSISYYGVDPKLPGFLRGGFHPRAGLEAFRPR